MASATPKLMSSEEINEQFDMSSYEVDYERVIFFDGDTVIAEGLSADWAREVLKDLNEDDSTDDILIMVNGNLNVEGNINIGDYHPHLLVLGNVHCEVLKSGDDTIHITGDAHIKYAFYGYYNDGSIDIEGTTYVPYVLNSDHASSVKPSGAVLINLYSDHNDFFEYDYTSGVLAEVMIPDVFDKEEVNVWKFIDLVKAGKSPFKEGAKPMRLVYEEELNKIVSGNIEAILELDWSDKKLTVFPEAIGKLKFLKKLTISNNNISTIPAVIAELENLEELYMSSCGITNISEAIGKLKKLRIWDLSTNYHLEKIPESIGDLSNLECLKVDHIPVVFPESLARLEKLEEISMYSCYRDNEKPGILPAVITKLKNLKSLDLRECFIEELPEDFLNIQTLEAFSWTGGRLRSASFPDFRKFKNLKKLVIAKKFNFWKKFIFEMPSLEYLDIRSNQEQKEYFTQDTIDLWEKMMPEKSEEFRRSITHMLNNKQLEADGRFSCIISAAMKAEDLRDINKLPNLKYLDLSSNKLTDLPDTFFELKKLEYVNLVYNNFPDELKQRIIQSFPNTNVELMDEMEKRMRGIK